MKHKSAYIHAFIKLVVSMFICVSFFSMFLACNEAQKAGSSIEGESIISLLEETIYYADYSTVDWPKVDSLFYRPYNCDWEITFPNLKVADDFPNHVACEKWHLLQNAKKDFHQKTAIARTINDNKTRLALLQVESSFDSVFYYFVKDEFYMRSFIDNYNPIMSKAFDDFTLLINKQ